MKFTNSNTSHRAIVILLVISITLLHYLTASHQTMFHILYRELYYLPIILAAFWFGLKGGLATSLIITLLYSPLALFKSSVFTAESFANLLEILLYNIVGGLLGLLRSRERERQKALHRAENLATMGRMVSTLAHDMKTPLIAISGFTKQVQKKLNPEHPACGKLDLVLRQTARLEYMVKDMLAFGRPLRLEKKETDLNRIISEAIVTAKQKAQNEGVLLNMEPAPTELRADVDQNRLQQALLNLIANAIEASPKGAQVTVRALREKNEAIIEVIDQGDGIPPETRQEIFNPFFTTKSEGTGLGLPIVKKIVEAHGGFLELLNKHQKGTVFRLDLPAA